MEPFQPTTSVDHVRNNLAALRAFFPDAFIEGKVDFDVLKQLLGAEVDEREEKYGLNWHGKRRARQLALTPSTGTLRPCPGDGVDEATTKNIVIEGDNLEVLKLLQKSYSGKVKLIYIDPPYNTGKDFVYPDDFRDSIGNYKRITGSVDGEGSKLTNNPETSGRFHTDWLNMMYPRLKLARNLLHEDGILLISIADEEIDNLRHVCNDVLGAENFIACMTWEKGRKNDAKLISIGHEYVLIYAKSLVALREKSTVWREEKPGAREIWDKYLELKKDLVDDTQKIEDALQTWFSDLPRTHPSKKWSRYKNVDKNGPWRDHDISWPGGGGPTYDLIHPKTNKPCKVPERGWVFASLEKMLHQIKIGTVVFREDHTEPPFRKAHIKPLSFELLDDDEAGINGDQADDEDELATQVRGTYFYKQSQVSVKYLRGLFGGSKVFNNPKDYLELARLFGYTTADSEAIFLDFFAGSGTTGHAVMSLNSADGGNRRFILVQLPEPLDPAKKDQKIPANFCDTLGKPRNIAELTKERLRRARKKIREEFPLYSGDYGFMVFKEDSSNIRTWEPDKGDLKGTLEGGVVHIKPDRTEGDILTELLLKLGLDLCVPIELKTVAGKVVKSVGAGVLLVCLDASITRIDAEPLALGIAAWHKKLAPAGETTVVFLDSAFEDDVAKSNLAAILQQHDLTNVRSL